MACSHMPLRLPALAKQCALAVLAVCVATTIPSPTSAAAGVPLLRAVISIHAPSLHCTPDGKWCSFVANTIVQNMGAAATTITVWTQPGWSWVSDDADIYPDISALKSAPSSIVLAPGEKYASRVDLACQRRQSSPHVFKLGFLPNAERPASGIPGIKANRGIAWSNSVDVPRACFVDHWRRQHSLSATGKWTVIPS